MTNLTVADVLERAADLIEPEGAWTRKANARNADGDRVSVSDGEAVCFCMAGAIMRANGGDYPWRSVAIVLPRPDEPSKDWLVAFNDAPERTQAEVVAKLRGAAALAREQGK